MPKYADDVIEIARKIEESMVVVPWTQEEMDRLFTPAERVAYDTAMMLPADSDDDSDDEWADAVAEPVVVVKKRKRKRKQKPKNLLMTWKKPNYA